MAQTRLSFADLMETARSFPQEVRVDPSRLAFTMAVAVIRHFFGNQWCDDHIIQDAAHSRPAGFLRLDFTPGFEGERKTSRVLDFAETLFNLQHIEGFDERLDQMRAGQVEPAIAEFDFARFLYLHDIGFKFVTPTGAKGEDYDFGIEYADGREACADAKCRLEGTEVRPDTVKNSLNKARTNNLPPDKPGIIFLKVPQTWLEQENVRRGIYAVVEGFLRHTERIVSVVVYTTVTTELAEQKMMLLRHRFHEFLDASHRLITKPAARDLRDVPRADVEHIDGAFEHMRSDPYGGDIKFLKGTNRILRRRVGAWRVLFEVHADRHLVVILGVTRRSSNTY